MKLRLTFLLCALSLALPALAAAATPSWGQVPSRPVRGPQVQPRHNCNLAGLWKTYPTRSPGAWVRLRFTEKQKLPANVVAYVVQQPVPGGRRGVAYFDPARGRIEVRTLLWVQYPYGISYETGTISPDCHHVSLTAHAYLSTSGAYSMDWIGR